MNGVYSSLDTMLAHVKNLIDRENILLAVRDFCEVFLLALSFILIVVFLGFCHFL
jgi:hypothetical protein